MSKRSENSLKHIKDLFAKEPDTEEKSWVILNDFYHYLLTWMENNNKSKADLARILGKSRASITKMFSQNPNISIKKIVEMTHPLGLHVKLGIEQVQESLGESKSECVTESIKMSLVNTPISLQTVPKTKIQRDWQSHTIAEVVVSCQPLSIDELSENLHMEPTKKTPDDFDLSLLNILKNKKEDIYAWS